MSLRLAEIRAARGLTLAELSRRTNIDRQSLHRYEKGLQDPSFGRVVRIADELGVTPNDLMHEREREAPAEVRVENPERG